MPVKRIKVKISAEEIIKRVEKEINREVMIKVPIKGIKVDFGGGEDWSWIWGLMVVGLVVVLGVVIRQKDITIRQLIDEKNRAEMTPVIITPTATPTNLPTLTLVPTKAVTKEILEIKLERWNARALEH